MIAASSLGTVFEWYDFYLYGLLATILSAQFFSGVNETTGFILALAAFAAGFAVRPLGAIVFGRVGDLVGRKNTFLVTMAIMGLSTFFVGLLPSYASIGIAAPVLLVTLRILQGLALGGEYGGAATYVAEHAPHHKRGFHTSFIQTTATVGLFAALIVVIATRTWMGEEAFAAWRQPDSVTVCPARSPCPARVLVDPVWPPCPLVPVLPLPVVGCCADTPTARAALSMVPKMN